MQFNEYLRQCRDQNQLTQEQLVTDLYAHDTKQFGSLDSRALGKWEQGTVKPKAAKQVSIIKYFQLRTGIALPCWSNYSVKETESLICKAGMNNLIGKSKKHIFDFPSETMSTDDINIYPLRHSEGMEALIDNNMHHHQSLNHEFSQISREQFKEWALHSSSLFLVCEHKGVFLGLLFSIKVKPNIFNKVLNFEMKKSDITIDDFALFDEMGSSLMLSFFSLSQKVATLLFIRYYAHLISNQINTADIGGLTHTNEGKNLVSNMNLQYQNSITTDDNVKIIGYKQSLSNVLASEYAVKMLLSRQECPEE